MRLIDIEAVLKAAELAGKEYVSIDFLKDFEQVDAVPVVRCRECKSHGTLKSGELFCGKIKTGIYGYYHTVKADDYCSCGAKMEDKL